MSNLLKFFLTLLILSVIAYFYLIHIDYGGSVFDSAEYVAEDVLTVMSMIIAIWYFVFFKQKKLFLSLFLLCFNFSKLLVYAWDFIESREIFRLVNVLYTLAYIFLSIEIIKDLNIKKILTRFTIPVLVLLGLSIYIGYALISVERIALESYSIEITRLDNFLDFFYFFSLGLTFSASLINYMSKNDNKSFYLFLGCLFLVFNVILSMGSYYLEIAHKEILELFWLLFTLLAFYFLLLQCDLKYMNNEFMFDEDF